MKARLKCIISGKVQGVFFRDFAEKQALDRGIVGAVSNGRDGKTVHIVAEGEKEKLEKFLAIVRFGSALAEVDDVDEQWLDTTGEFSTFSIVGGGE